MMRNNWALVKKEFNSLIYKASSYIDEVFRNCGRSDFIGDNLRVKVNMILSYSALVFFLLCSQTPFRTRYILGVIVAFLMVRKILKMSVNIVDFMNFGSIGLKIGCLLSSLGIVFENQRLFYEANLNQRWFKSIDHCMFMTNETVYFVSFIIGLLAVPFVYLCMLLFFAELKRIFNLKTFIRQMHNVEVAIYILIGLVTIGFMSDIFCQSNAFYSSGINYDVIYTSDSTKIFHDNAYLSLFHNQNDFRQPLFALFSAPFLGVIFFVSKMFCLSEVMCAIMTNSVQICLLVLANLMLSRLLNLQCYQRICFMIFVTCTYTYILFSLMMEQYIFAYFWLIFFIYLYKVDGDVSRLVYWGAGSTLLTSIVIFPIVLNAYKKFSFSTFFQYLKEFVFLMILFGRIDVIINSINSILFFMGFTGKGISLSDRIYQYIAFIQSCFIAPNHNIDLVTTGHVSWQLEEVSKLSIVGCGILLVVIVSAFVNQKNEISTIASSWIVFSAIMLCGLGWGTKENGLILYSLYFGWAFVLAVCLFIKKVENYLGMRYIFPIVMVILALGIFNWNVSSINEVINFAITHYPV